MRRPAGTRQLPVVSVADGGCTGPSAPGGSSARRASPSRRRPRHRLTVGSSTARRWWARRWRSLAAATIARQLAGAMNWVWKAPAVASWRTRAWPADPRPASGQCLTRLRRRSARGVAVGGDQVRDPAGPALRPRHRQDGRHRWPRSAQALAISAPRWRPGRWRRRGDDTGHGIRGDSPTE